MKPDEASDSIMCRPCAISLCRRHLKTCFRRLVMSYVFIVLLKETSVAGYIALQDLTKAGDIIRSRTYDAFMPLIAVALIYLAMVLIFTKLVNMLERRLRNSDH